MATVLRCSVRKSTGQIGGAKIMVQRIYRSIDLALRHPRPAAAAMQGRVAVDIHHVHLGPESEKELDGRRSSVSAGAIRCVGRRRALQQFMAAAGRAGGYVAA